MRLAVISDVHGNLIALDAVLRDLRDERIDQIVGLGDMIQGGPQPAETVARLRELGGPVVMGNSDAFLLSGKLTGNEQMGDEALRRLLEVRDWQLAQLTAADRAYIEGFVPTAEIALDDSRRFLGFHGSPTDFDEFIFPHTAEDEFQRKLAPYADRILAGGHIHLQFRRRIGENFFFNPGSVGVAYNHAQEAASFRLDPWAEYAILTVEGSRVGLEFRRVGLDVDRIIAVYRDSGRPHAAASIAQYVRH